MARVGLALGSGSARGWAHIGVINALRARGITPDVIVGSSIGAYVGAAHACGRLDQLEAWVRSLSSWDVVSLLDIRFRTGGMLRGEKLFDWASDLTDLEISALPCVYGAVATDLLSGKEIWLDNGALLPAVKASMSVPGMFVPRQIEGRWLVDGGVVNPVPVSLCRALGADIVIAVNLNEDLRCRQWHELRSDTALAAAPDGESEGPGYLDFLPDAALKLLMNKLNSSSSSAKAVWQKLWGAEGDPLAAAMAAEGKATGADGPPPSIWTVMAASINIMQDRITRSRMAGDPPEVLITPRLNEFSMMDYHRADAIIAEGEKSVDRAWHLLEVQLELAIPAQPST